MNRLRKLLLHLILHLPVALMAQDTLFFDAQWQPATRDQYEYYRPMPLKKVGELMFIQDFYKNGNLQMQGYALADDEEALVGDAYWYGPEGYDFSKKQSVNRSSQRELHYYHGDGSLWKTISYSADGRISRVRTFLGGKQLTDGAVNGVDRYSGTFSPAVPDAYYDEPSYEDDAPQAVEVAAPAPIAAAAAPAGGQMAYREVVYWANGQKARQVEYDAERMLLYSRYWDNAGKLLAEMPRDDAGTRYSYYSRNGLAAAVAQQEVRSKNEPAKRVVQDMQPDGGLLKLSTFIDGNLSEETVYADGEPVRKRTYRDGQPFDGYFEQQHAFGTSSYQMRQGQIEGTVKTTGLTAGDLLSEGVYKQGKPFDGTFFLGEDTCQLLQYRQGVQHGVQKIYADYGAEVLAEEYEMKAGRRDGYRRIYTEGSLLFESQYRDDKPISGTIIEGPLRLHYEQGLLTERGTIDRQIDGRILMIEKFKDNQIQEVSYRDFTIAENPLDEYRGVYKGGKPYQGYFKVDTLVDDIRLIGLFENGACNSVYSFELLDQMENYMHYTYDRKTTYSGGKPVDGAVYRLIGRERLLTTYYRAGDIYAFDVNVFAMHYFNRISAALQPDSLTLTELAAPLQIKAYAKGGDIVAELSYEGEVLRTSRRINALAESSAGSISQYYLAGDAIKVHVLEADFVAEEEERDDERISGNALLPRLFNLFPVQQSADLKAVFFHLYDNFMQENFNRVFKSSINGAYPVNEENYLCMLDFDEQGSPRDGIRLKVDAAKAIHAEMFVGGKVKEKKTFGRMSELLKDDRKELRAMEHRMLNKY